MFEEAGINFYLTGGTALSRAYFHHRYSDDLDFFINNDPDFIRHTEQALQILNNFKIKITIRSESIVSIIIDESLKIDFVNDVSFYSGNTQITEIFNKTDNIQNILSNKVSALIGRDEPKQKKFEEDIKRIISDILNQNEPYI
ncbi:MAG: nucleotidyl transferase AbiEii/AbiGii toxin family protein [Candidatus Dojkabacteria bacterium]